MGVAAYLIVFEICQVGMVVGVQADLAIGGTRLNGFPRHIIPVALFGCLHIDIERKGVAEFPKDRQPVVVKTAVPVIDCQGNGFVRDRLSGF